MCMYVYIIYVYIYVSGTAQLLIVVIHLGWSRHWVAWSVASILDPSGMATCGRWPSASA